MINNGLDPNDYSNYNMSLEDIEEYDDDADFHYDDRDTNIHFDDDIDDDLFQYPY